MAKKKRKKSESLKMAVKINRDAYDMLWALADDSGRTLGAELSRIVVVEYQKRTGAT